MGCGKSIGKDPELISHVALAKAYYQKKSSIKYDINILKIKKLLNDNSDCKDLRELRSKKHFVLQKIEDSREQLSDQETISKKRSLIYKDITCKYENEVREALPISYDYIENHSILDNLKKTQYNEEFAELEESSTLEVKKELLKNLALQEKLKYLQKVLIERIDIIEENKNKIDNFRKIEDTSKIEEVSMIKPNIEMKNRSLSKSSVPINSTQDTVQVSNSFSFSKIALNDKRGNKAKSISPIRKCASPNKKRTLEDIKLYPQLTNEALNLRSKLLLKEELRNNLIIFQKNLQKSVIEKKSIIKQLEGDLIYSIGDGRAFLSKIRDLKNEESVLKKEIENSKMEKDFLKNIAILNKQFKEYQLREKDFLQDCSHDDLEYLLSMG
ncbi:hypothetical protein SteCoe_23290 [Stentor coeruleus]|uniref:Uncharacterized protein n=1 Tax=Stentor coeruleus TaxID=5963 RepID=A0A1R2BK88_9CILI|nr:hypothetical protein SteCoe_23290 [Stentor coeruleus]